MAIDFGGLATTDNYSTAYTPKINEAVKALAYMLDPAYASYTGTPFTGSKRFNGGVLEQFNGASWVAQTLGGAGSFTTLGASGLATLSSAVGVRGNAVPSSGVGIELLYDGTESVVQSYDRSSPGYKPLWLEASDVRIGINGARKFTFDATGLAVTGVLSATGNISQPASAWTGIDAARSIVWDNGTTGAVWSNGGTIQLKAGGTLRATVSTTGFDVTGTLSATDVGIGVTPGGPLSVRAGGTYDTHIGYGANYDNYYTVGASGTHIFRSATEWMRLNSIGLSVTGSVVASASDSSTGGYGFTGFTDYRIWASANNLNFRIGGAGTTFQVTNNGAAVIGTLTTSKRAYTTSTSVAFSATPTFDASASNFHIFGALTANVTSVTLSNAQEGQFVTVRFTQDGTGGRTITTGNMGATNAPSIQGAPSTTANKASYLNLTYNATAARWEGSWLGTV